MEGNGKTGNVILDRSFDFSLKVIDLYKDMIGNKEYVLSKQVLRSGTSVGSNVEEAIGGYSKKDFAAKMGISLKEARETRYWCRLIKYGEFSKVNIDWYIQESTELINILTKIVKTSQGN
jgi:four helix bundle protein